MYALSGFIEGEDRTQATLFPERIDDYVAEDSPVRVAAKRTQRSQRFESIVDKTRHLKV